MASRGSNRHDVLVLEKLIRNHINIKENSMSTAVLSSMVNINGNDLIDALENLGFETEKETENYNRLKAEYPEKVKAYENLEAKYKKLDEDYKVLINNLELFIKDSLPEKIKNLIKNIKIE